MNRIYMALTILFTFSVTFQANAQWSKQGQDLVANFNKSQLTCDPATGGTLCQGFLNVESYVDTLVGSVAMIAHQGGMEKTYPGGLTMNVVLPGRPFVSPNGQDLGLHLTLYRPSTVQSDFSKTPLVVYLPGIFQGTDIVHTYIAVELLLKEGYQVLVIPNPLSAEYLRSFPAMAPASFKAEAEIVLSVIKWARQNLIGDSAKLSIVGGSYGGYLAARLLGMLDEHPEISQLVNGQVSLLEPPWSMNFAIERLDSLVGVSLRYSIGGISADQFGSNFHASLKNLVDWMQYDYREHEATGFVARNNYAASAGKILDNFDLKNKADTDVIRFRWIIDELEPENQAQYTDGQDLTGHWLQVASKQGFTRVRILAADDDILSRQQDLVSIPETFRTPEHLLMRAGGGHVGFIDEPMFRELIHTEFKQN